MTKAQDDAVARATPAAPLGPACFRCKCVATHTEDELIRIMPEWSAWLDHTKRALSGWNSESFNLCDACFEPFTHANDVIESGCTRRVAAPRLSQKRNMRLVAGRAVD